MKRKLSVAAASAGLLLLASAGAGAEGQASVYFGRAGVDVIPIGSFSTYGGSVGVFSRFVGAELALEYAPLGGFDLGFVGVGASMTNLMGNVVVQVPLGNVQPYGTVGYGALIGSAGIDPFFRARGTVGALNYGLGGKIFFSDRIGVRVDYRRFAVATGDLVPDVNIPFIDVPLDLNPDIDRFIGGVMIRF